MALTQDQLAQQMVAQLRVLDPAISAEVGTPERKIIDTVAQGIAEAQIDITLLSGALDLDAKLGSDLDVFVGLFGFGRQSGSFAKGFVTFSRSTASPYDIVIPSGTQVQGVSTLASTESFVVVLQTTSAVTLSLGSTEVIAPVQALLSGAQSNLAPGALAFANLGAPPLGITAVRNDTPIAGGADPESDPELKVRFRNTVFRNLAGTEDQYLALAIATQFSTKAVVLGPVSRYREYIQVPAADDASSTIDGGGNGLAGQWTTLPSNNPYAKYVHAVLPYFVSNGLLDASTVFYRQDTDFRLNVPPLDVGDTYREFHETPSDIPNPASTPTNPNVTFFNVYTGIDPLVTLPRPSDVVLLEYAYLSSESRNDITRNITNCVDVYINGENPTIADAVIPPPSASTPAFNSNGTDAFYYQNFRRVGQPDVPPTVGNLFTALFWQPVIAVPEMIVVESQSYVLGTHYWAVEDKTLLGNTVRTRNGLEWDQTARGDTNAGPGTGTTIVATGATSITIANYTYDKNVIDLQAALEGSRQVTTDVLAHRSASRYFKLDLTVVYAPGASQSATNTFIQSALQTFFDGQYFGTTIQMTDLLLVVRNANGVRNVRWSNDVLPLSDEQADLGLISRVTECDISGTPRQSTITANATTGNNVLTAVVVSTGSPAVGQVLTGTGIPMGTTITSITGDSYTLSANFTGTTGRLGFTVLVVFNADFYLLDSELPALPTGTVSGDALPGLILRPRAQNTFTIT